MKILTVPEVIADPKIVYPVGNEWVALPEVREDGSIPSFNILSEAKRGLIEFKGGSDPLLRPALQVDGVVLNLQKARWRRLEDWIPRFELEQKGLFVRGTIFCPQGFHGFIYLLEMENNSSYKRSCDLGWLGNWAAAGLTIFRSRNSGGENIAWYNSWTRTLLFEHRCGFPVAAWSLGLSEPLSEFSWHLDGQTSGDEVSCPAGQGLKFGLSKAVALEAGDTYQLALYAGVNKEADGAAAYTVHLQRCGWTGLLNRHRRWLREHRAVTSPGGDSLAHLCNLNSFYNYFFARGRCLDTGKLVLITSRSPRYYVSAAFWARDAFLWSFPGLLLIRPQAARDALLAGASTYWEHIGEHSLYLDGTKLYPGFELDEQAAWFLALQQYLNFSGDWALVEEVGFNLFRDYLETLKNWRGPQGLYATFLSPTDDPVKYPYLTYNNVLVWKSLQIIAEVLAAFGRDRAARRMKGQAAGLKQAIKKHCLCPGPTGLMYAWSVSGAGECEILDQPPGSLQLLEYYGFCPPQDQAYQNTLRFIHSGNNPHYVSGTFSGPACEHAPYPWVLSLVYELINGDRGRALKLLAAAPLDSGIACETIDPVTGRVKTGAAFAACAGFLAYALSLALNSGAGRGRPS
ncbi:MAG: glycoside hydrolase family 125 protein [Firmicutes bacterium]|nr:glycoside hydrolase family 125 protein [Bacillota bacterium]